MRKLSNLFAKENNDFIKITVMMLIMIVLIIFFSKVVTNSYAIPNTLPDTLTSGMGNNSERITLFEELEGDEQLNLVPYYATDGTGARYTVYCLDKEKEWAPDYTITKDNTALDQGYVYLIQNGYPAKSLTGNNAHDDYLTQIAVWWYQDLTEGTTNLTEHQKSVISSSGYYRYIEPLITGAVNAKNNPITINPTFSINSSDFKLSSDNNYLITDTITVNSNVAFNNYNVTVNNSAVEVLDSNNNVTTDPINSGSGFKLRVNLAKVDNPFSVNVSVTVNYTEYEAYSYTPPNEIMQNALPAALVPVTKQKTVSTDVAMPTGSLTIKKVDSTDNSPLSGASIEVIRKATNKTIASFETTTEDYVINNLLPGAYEIKETKAPNGYYIDNLSTTVTITDTNLNISKTISNSKFQVQIRKVDSTTKEAVAGATLKILNNNTNEEVYRFTSTNSYVTIPNLAEGTYKVVEEKAPDGYIINSTPKTFTVDKDNKKVTIDFENTKNEILIEKRDASSNDLLSGATLRLVRVSDNATIDEWTTTTTAHKITGLTQGNYKVIEITPPSGYTLSNNELTFTITGTEQEALTLTFYNSKNQITITKVDENNNPLSGATLVVTNSSNQQIAEFTTTEKPYTLDKLTPGTYYIEETKSPDGYVLNSNKVSFTVTEDTSNLQVQFKNSKNELRLGKIDADTKEYIAGATLRLTNSNGDEIANFTSGSEPYVITGIASGTYYLEELKAPNGYIRNKDKVEVIITDEDNTFTYTIDNKKTKVTINKVDSDNKEPLSGITFELLDSNKSYLRTITTTNSPTVLTDLNEGVYYLRETNTLPGYVLDKTLHEFTIDRNNPEVNITIENKPIVVSLGKVAANTNTYISGATMQLTREDGIMEPITFISKEEPYVIRGLEKGIYALSEIEAPPGYINSSAKIVFEVLETGEVQNINLRSDLITITIFNRKLELDSNGVSGYKFILRNSNGETIKEITTTTDIYTTEELPLGNYTLVMLLEDGKEVPYHFTITDSNIPDVINFINDFTKVKISKKDFANSEEVAGANLVIKDSEGKTVASWTSTDTPYYIEKLPVGKYTLIETSAPNNYMLNTSTVDFEVLETGEIQTVTMFNSKLVEVPNTSKNATYLYLGGGLLIITGGILIYLSYRNKARVKSS